MGNQQSSPTGDLSFDLSSPSTPFTQPIGGGGLQVGKMMFIEGEALDLKRGEAKKDRFHINFDADEKEKEVALHYDVRFLKDEKTIVLNSRHNGKWQKEERIQNTFELKQPFRIEVQITPESFIISSNNGLPSYPFKYRIKPEKITKITIDGAVKINRIFYGYPPSTSPPQHPPALPVQSAPGSGSTFAPFPILLHGAPYSPTSTGEYGGYSAPPMSAHPNAALSQPHFIQGGMHIGRQIVISGTPNATANRFSIDLNAQPGNTALHIDVRFNENVIVRNSMRANKWEHEERQGAGFPFQRNHPFQMQILCDHVGYKIAVNGQHFADFYHRIEASTVQSVATSGDLSSANVEIF